MSSDEATSATARMPADLSGRESGRSLVGLLGVLDLADGSLVRPHRPRRSAAYGPAAYRRGSVRRVPLRTVPRAPVARIVPASRMTPFDVLPCPEPGLPRLRTLTRRLALWGAGPNGEHLAWRSAQPARRSASGARAGLATGAHGAHGAGEPAARPGVTRLRTLARRVALWGAGPRGEYLAWGSSLPRSAWGARPDADRPVVLRELPSTPTIQPATSSPVAALLPRVPASSAGPQGARPVPPGAVPVPGVRPRGRLERSEATGWPSLDRFSPSRPSTGATGLVRARGDPLTCPVRGSPLPARRSRSPGSTWSSFP